MAAEDNADRLPSPFTQTHNSKGVPTHLREFLRFLWSKDGQGVVAKVKLVPPDSARIPPQLGSPIDNIWK